MGEVRTVMFQAVTDVAMQRGAVLSLDGVYRYHLWRRLGPGDRSLGFVMLNPSTADANEDDPTIRKCVGFARTLGYDMVEVCNLFALRSTDPKGLRGPLFPTPTWSRSASRRPRARHSPISGSASTARARGRRIRGCSQSRFATSLTPGGPHEPPGIRALPGARQQLLPDRRGQRPRSRGPRRRAPGLPGTPLVQAVGAVARPRALHVLRPSLPAQHRRGDVGGAVMAPTSWGRI